jgi:lipoate-protein ligase A
MAQKSGISEGRVDYKVSGGKLIRVRVRYRGDVIESVNFYGDFFMHPEEAIEELEKSLSGKRLDEAERTILSFFDDVELIGAKPDDFINALRIAVNTDNE